MRKYNNIRTLEELQREIQFLKADYTQKGIMIKSDAKAYVQQFSIGNLLKKFVTPSSFFKLDEKLNISSTLMSLVLPTILNKTIFSGSGLLTKGLAGLVSSKIGKSLDAESLTGIFNGIKSLFSSKKKKDKDVKFVDYGIPPDSETY